jgi:hypothetical protein
MRRSIVAAAAIVFAAAGLQPALAQAWVQQLQAQVEKVRPTFEQRGYHQASWSHSGLLAQGASERIDLTLPGGGVHQLLGLCDNDCGDTDLKLYDAAGKLVDSDVKADDYPLVAARPTAPARYTVEISMVKCRASTCGYMIQLYSK